MRANGAKSSCIHLIPDGIDFSKFFKKNQESCRQGLGIDTASKMILAVGDRLELKGFHLVVDALPAILIAFPNTKLFIVGGPGRSGRDYTAQIKIHIERYQLSDHVKLVGSVPHCELVDWYNAADLFAIMSSREGSPNGLLEALACGTPAVGTPVGGIADELKDSRRGLILLNRDSQSASDAILYALGQTWNKDFISQSTRCRTWWATANKVNDVLRECIERNGGETNLFSNP